MFHVASINFISESRVESSPFTIGIYSLTNRDAYSFGGHTWSY